MAQQHVPHEDAATSAERAARPSAVITASGTKPPARAAAQRLAAALPSAKTRLDLARRVVAPLLIALVPLWWVADATYRSSLMTVGRDQGIFQYIAWAVRAGDVDYRDIHDVNGPLIHLVHMALIALGGHEEHRFHVLELWASSIAFAACGWFLAGFVRGRRVWVVERLAWAAAAWVVLSGQYQVYFYWNQAQRESFCDWFLLPSIALQIAAPPRTRRGASIRIAAFAALTTITCFGKPSFALFTIAQLFVLVVDRDSVFGIRARISRFAIGAAAGATIPLLYLLRFGDVGAFVKTAMVDVPRVYRFIWVKSPHEILGTDGPLLTATMGLTAGALVLALVALRELPRRALALGLAPFCALIHVIAQAKGFGYHFHPLTATTSLAWLALVEMLVERSRERRFGRSTRTPRWLALAAATALAWLTANAMQGSPQLRNVWILAGAESPYKRGLPEYFDTFKSYDFFPWDMRLAAEYLREHTAEDARVQTHGMDPYLLYLARRHSATPYIYAYDVNADAALDGGWWAHPTDAEAAFIRQARDGREADMLTRMQKAPPAAFVFIDNSPLLTWQDAVKDFEHCCAKTSAWVKAGYREARTFGVVHVWMRNDLAAVEASER